ncbi:MAG: alkaline phosphatase D family protein [Lautropia sp.]|nr:alkaline phosphatase D family protein [Lautropia sp.]
MKTGSSAPLPARSSSTASRNDAHQSASDTMPNPRRDFVIRLSSLAALGGSGLALSGCGGGDDENPNAPRFDYGVASGDPLADRVILWTHARYPNRLDDVPLRWEVAPDASFSQIIASGHAVASATRNHTVSVDALGLAPGQSYCYRFRHDSPLDTDATPSPVGQTRTLPAASVDRVSFAVLSCSNYPAGYFHAYGEAARSGAQYALHLGDFIYEYGPGGYASADAERLNRVSEPRKECVSLDDYRTRYAQYRSDPNCKLMSAAMPMIAIWDDHEIADNAWLSGAEEHTDATEGSWGARRDAALQAWYEWLPVRQPDPANPLKIYRRFDFGNLLTLCMLETRVVGREEQIDLSELQGAASAVLTMARLLNPTRTMLGAEQRNWLLDQWQDSTATWQILGQQVLMARMTFPVSILSRFGEAATNPNAVAASMQAVQEYLTARALSEQNPDALSGEQRRLLDTRLNPRVGYNMDAWDGYPAERERLLAEAHRRRKKLVVLAGDTHNAWASQLTLLDGNVVGFEYGTTSISSPGMEEEAGLSTIPPAQTREIFMNVVRDLRFADTSRRGFMTLDVTPEAVSGQWHFLDSVKSGRYTIEKTEPLVYRG